MPNPRANRPLTLDQVTADLKSLSQPAFYPRVGNIQARGVRSPQPQPMREQTGPQMPQWGDYDISVPTQANRAMSQRLSEQDVLERSRANADISPLEKVGAAMQAARLVGSGLTQLALSMPTRIRSGDQAADDYISENIYQPNIPKAAEYAGDLGEMMEQLETKYKLPPMMPELLAFQEMAGPVARQVAKTGAKAGRAAGMNALQAINDAMIHQTGPLSQGPLSMLAPKGAVSHVFEPNPNWKTNTVNFGKPTPGIMIPSKMSNVREAVRDLKGNYGARRVERAADEIPNLERMFKEDALKQAFTGDNASAMITLSPAEFERYSIELSKRHDIGPKMAQLAKEGNIDKYTVPTDDYIQYLQRLNEGFSDVPYLNLSKDEVGLPTMPRVIGHEGRHRSRALAEKGAPTSLVQINPRGDLREGMPRRTQEEFIEALKEELERSNRLVLPEKDGEYRRPAIELPEPYAEGGSVNISDNPDTMMMELGDKHFQVGGIVDAAARAAKAAKAAQMKKAMKASEALAQIEGKNLNITQADRTKVGEGLLGGPGFSGLQLQEGPHKQAGAVWGVKNPGTAKTMLGGFKDPLGKEYFTTMIGSPTQHQSNQMVFDKLYGKFKSEAKKGNLDPELQQKINERLANAVDKDGNPVFPPDVDILSKDFKKIANTFDRRSIAGNLIGGVGVGGRKGQIIDYDKIIRDTTDPFLLDMPSGSLGHRLWTPSGEIIERPDLHPAFPAIATGEDLGVEFTPAAQDILMAPWIENVRQTKGRNPGYMDWTRGRPPSVQVSDEILRNLEESGNKEGGAITVKPKKDGQKFKPGRKPDQILKHGQAMPRGKDPEVDIGQMAPMMMAGGGEVNADDLILEERPL